MDLSLDLFDKIYLKSTLTVLCRFHKVVTPEKDMSHYKQV